MKSLKILLVNERGCFDQGIIALAKVLANEHRVNIVAPLRKKERVGGSITAYRPLKTDLYYALKKAKIFSVDGSPCDCVGLALDKLLKSKPDLIISGIDPHHNRGETMFSSGVSGAAILGTILGIKSIAISADVKKRHEEKEYLAIARSVLKILPDLYHLLQKEQDTTLNINYPAVHSVRRVKWTHLTTGMIEGGYTSEINPFGKTFYWMNNPNQNYPLNVLDQQGDIYWLKKGFITVTPLKYDLTSRLGLDVLTRSGISL